MHIQNGASSTRPLQTKPKAIAGRFYQLLSGHAMTAPFLKGRRVGVDRVGPVPAVRSGKAEPGAPVRGAREWKTETHRLGMTPTPRRSFLS